MYAPKGFKLRLAIRLGELVSLAYDQFLRFVEGGTWGLPEGYELIRELSYSSKPLGALDRGGKLEDYLEMLRAFGGWKRPHVPVGFIARKGNEAFVIFRGTQTAKEWINNLNAKLARFFIEGYGSVHEGFLASYLSLRDQVIEAVAEIPNSRRIHIAGHSLGSAFAIFAACDIARALGRKTASLYTFGSPRIGDAAFADAIAAVFAERTFRIANTSDFVTEIPFPVPFANLFGGFFAHVETPVVFTDQREDLEENHAVGTYIGALKDWSLTRPFYARLFGG